VVLSYGESALSSAICADLIGVDADRLSGPPFPRSSAGTLLSNPVIVSTLLASNQEEILAKPAWLPDFVRRLD
jgi:hypothetical protein